MSKIERGQFSSLLRRYLGMTGTSDVVDELAPEISATFTLEAERPEWEFLKGQRLMSITTQVTAVAAKQSVVRIRNPATSGVVAIFTHWSITTPFTTGVVYTWFTLTRETDPAVDLVDGVATIARDTRLPTTQGSALIASKEALDAPSGTAWHNAGTETGIPYQLNGPSFVLTPGHAVQLVGSEDNIALFLAVHWLEKRLDPLEAS